MTAITDSRLRLRTARPADLPSLEILRAEAFAPIFASFRELLGDEIYQKVQKHEDEGQADLLSSMFTNETVWQLFVAELEGEIVGFVSFKVDNKKGLGEIGLNAVRPIDSGKGIGTAMYGFAVARMREAGLKAAVVATGGDASHAAARRAYEKSGFTVSIPSLWMCQKL